jgi:hypothetical protein
MHLTITAVKAILMSKDSSPERKERALAELQRIPPNDPRYGDAQQVLSELGLVAETANLSPTPDKRKYMPMTNSMFWCSMAEQQEAMDRYIGTLEAESNRLADLMCKWCDTKDETLLDSFNDAAPAFVEKSLAALAMTWEQVEYQISIWDQMSDMARRSDMPHHEIAPPDLVKHCKDGSEAPNFQRANLLILHIWPHIKVLLRGWNEQADAVGMDRAAFGKLTIYQREKKLYDIGWHPRTGLPKKGTKAQP